MLCYIFTRNRISLSVPYLTFSSLLLLPSMEVENTGGIINSIPLKEYPKDELI